MNFEVLIPITLFISIVYAIKVVVEARMRGKLMQGNGSEELIRSMLAAESEQRRLGSLRWGVLLLTLAVGFGVIEAFGWDEVTPGVIAVLLSGAGLGNLAYYFIARRNP